MKIGLNASLISEPKKFRVNIVEVIAMVLRIKQSIFALTLIAFSWLAMMVVHEFGHVAGAMVTGGQVQQVVLHPLQISRTDVSPNPHPGWVVWLGPIVGVLFPVLILALLPSRWVYTKNSCQFFAGFCLIANGAYIGVGSFEGIGDCHKMLASGSPIFVLWIFGIACCCSGFWLWHRLGTLRSYFSDENQLSWETTLIWIGLLVALISIQISF